MLLGDLGREDGARQAATMGSRVRARSVDMDERRATALARSSEQWLQWLRGGLAAQPDRGLAGLWDLLEDWFASDDFQTSGLAAAMAGLTGNGGAATRAVVDAHRRALRELLEEPAAAAGAADPAALAAQLHLLVEGAVVGALIDRHAALTRHARELTEIALARGGR
jgi:hypothetical protein